MHDKQYYVVSDIHSDATGLKTSLKKAGFDLNNENHILIILGDIFDRMGEAVEVYNFIQSIPQERRVLVKGNHELLYLDLLKKSWPDYYDWMNGTVDTFCQIAHKYLDPQGIDEDWEEIVRIVRKHPITVFIKSAEWKNYYELDKYIFVHSFIPYDSTAAGPLCNPNWRKASQRSFEDAMWGCPWKLYRLGLMNSEKAKGKILIHGHWHTSDSYKNLGDYSTDPNTNEIFCGANIIAIDGGISSRFDLSTEKRQYIHKQNVLIIKGNRIYDQYGVELHDQEQKKLNIEKDPSKEDDYWVDPNLYDNSLSRCGSDCSTPCARTRGKGPKYCTMSYFGRVCASYKKK